MSAKSNSQIQIAQPVRTRSSHDLHMWVKTNQLDMSITVICACCARMRWSKTEKRAHLCSLLHSFERDDPGHLIRQQGMPGQRDPG